MQFEVKNIKRRRVSSFSISYFLSLFVLFFNSVEILCTLEGSVVHPCRSHTASVWEEGEGLG